MARFAVPDGWTVQAFQFALDCTPEQEACGRRQFGGRRYARNWAVRTLKEDITRYRETGQETEPPSLAGLRRRWNQVKDTECTDAGPGEVWWPHISKEAFAGGIRAAADACRNWQASRAGKRRGGRAGFPRFARKGRDRDRVTFTTGAIRIEPGRRHVTLPRTGTVRVHENTRRLQRLTGKGRARIPAATVSRKGTRLVAAFGVLVQRPIQPCAGCPGSRVGMDVDVRVLATIAGAGRGGDRTGAEPAATASGAEGRVASIRGRHLHTLTTRLARTRGEIVAEGLDAAGMLAQKGLTGARARRRGLSGSALGETRRQLACKTGWYGSRLVIASRWYPSSRTCHACGHGQDIGWNEHRTCTGCGTSHQRDDNAAVNLARYEPPAAGDSAPAQSGPRSTAEPTVRPGLAGQMAMKRGRDPASRPGNNPETGCR